MSKGGGVQKKKKKKRGTIELEWSRSAGFIDPPAKWHHVLQVDHLRLNCSRCHLEALGENVQSEGKGDVR
jgi:hypothetical protein